MTTEINVGKYTVLHENGANLRALRHGEVWRDLCGDGLILALAQEIEGLREVSKAQETLIAILYSHGPDHPVTETADEMLRAAKEKQR